MFAKYRKEPWDTSDSPKYIYEKGGTVSLYGVHYPSQNKRLILCEGEFDVLSLRTAGYDALTSTGGAMSFQQDWVLDRVPTLLFDNDEAGVKGAIRTAFILGKCIISWIPAGFGKDASDVLQNKGKEFLYKLLDDPVRQIPIDLSNLERRKDILAKKKELQALTKNMEESVGKQIMQGICKKMIELEKAFVSHAPKRVPKDDREYIINLERAKAYPIDRVLKVEGRMAKCPFHNNGQEKTPSFHIYGDHGFCFGGCEDRKKKDVIDIYMKVHNVDHLTAVKILSNSL